VLPVSVSQESLSGKFVREAKVGGYSENLITAQERRILNKADELLEPDGLYFLELDTAG
jgi:hypothetical protein